MKIELKNLSKSYGRKAALKNVSLTLTPGIYGLLGPNGSGKSTMMNIITGNLLQTGGEVLFDGGDIRRRETDCRRHIGYCPQQQTFYPGFTAEQFLFYMSSLHGMKSKNAGERIEWALSLLSLLEVRRKKIKSLSGGMKQRLLIAQAILHDPDILILDEPTAGLDPRQRIAVRNLISEIALHKTVVISTHVVQDVEYISKELIFLCDGEVIEKGTSAELLRKIENCVWELTTSEAQLSEVVKAGAVCGIAKGEQGICVRMLCEEKPAANAAAVRPTLEDVYLHHFGAVVEL